MQITPEQARAELQRRKLAREAELSAQAQGERPVSKTESAARGFADSVTFGFADDVTGVLFGIANSLGLAPDSLQDMTFGEIVNLARSSNAERNQQAMQQNPGSYIAGSAGGALGGAGALSTAKTVGQSVAQGAKLGGLYGFGSSQEDTLSGRLGDAGEGAALGGAIGAVVPAVVNTATNVGKAILNPRRTVADVADSVLQVNPEKVATFTESNLTPTLADIGDSRPLQATQNFLSDTYGSSDVIKKAMDKTTQELTNYFEKEGISSAATQEKAGSTIQDSLRRYQDKGKEVAGNLKTRIEDNLPTDFRIDLTKTKQFLDGERAKFDSSEAVSVFENSPLGKLSTSINAAVEEKGSLSFNDATLFRQVADDQINTFGLMGDLSQGQLKNLRGLIKQDIEAAIAKTSPEAKRAYDSYNKFYTQFAKKNEEVLDKVLKNKTATETFRLIARNQKVDANLARNVMTSLKGPERQLFVDALFRELGTPINQEFNAGTLAVNFNRLQPEVRETLLKAKFAKPKERTQFEQVLNAVDAMKDTAARANNSGTTRTAVIGGLGYAIGSGNLAKAALTLGLGRIVSTELLTNPKFIAWASKIPNLKTPEETAKLISQISGLAKEVSPAAALQLNTMLKAMEEETTTPPSSLSITPEMAKRELERRRMMQTQ